MNRYLFFLLPLLFSANPASANVTLGEILGRWCGEITDYNFRKDRLDVSFHTGASRTLKIVKIEDEKGGSPGINIWWDVGTNTIFRLEKDGRLLIQLANVDESGKPYGDKGPRREFHRC